MTTNLYLNEKRELLLVGHGRVLKLVGSDLRQHDTTRRDDVALGMSCPPHLTVASMTAIKDLTPLPLEPLTRIGFLSSEKLQTVLETTSAVPKHCGSDLVTDIVLLDSLHVYLVPPMLPINAETNPHEATNWELRKVPVPNVVLMADDYEEIVRDHLESLLEIYARTPDDLRNPDWRRNESQRLREEGRRSNATSMGIGVQIWLRDGMVQSRKGQLHLPGDWESTIVELPLWPLFQLGVLAVPARYFPVKDPVLSARARALGLDVVRV